jgi:RNA polymerase sigma-70 factor (ECF subfamily)
MTAMPPDVSAAIESAYRADWGRIVATLTKLTGDFDLAEECAQEAFAAAWDQWKASGVPGTPAAWLIQTARHKAIDRIRRHRRLSEKLDALVTSRLFQTSEAPEDTVGEIPDDRLRLIFTCCHPALAPEAQIALTLHTLCGLETEEIARAFLVPAGTMAQRLVRAKRKIRDARIPYVVPVLKEMSARLDSVLTAIYLVFNEGYAATRGDALVRIDLCGEAIRLGRLIHSLMKPDPPREVTGLLALMLLHDARRPARYDSSGEPVLLEEQDRRLWNQAQIQEGLALADSPMTAIPGPFALQSAIAAVHCRAARAGDTEWRRILSLYDVLEQIQPSPIVSLNRAVAVAMTEGPRPALSIIEDLASYGELENYHLLHAARADLLRRSGAPKEAAASYLRAIALATNERERCWLERRLRELEAPPA